MERKIDQILTDGWGCVDRFRELIKELIESEAYSQLQVLLNRILGDNIPQQVGWKTMFNLSESKQILPILV
jgi:hypothetical protein